MFKSISFIVLTKLFHFNELKKCKATRLLHFLSKTNNIFLQCINLNKLYSKFEDDFSKNKTKTKNKHVRNTHDFKPCF